MMKKLICLILLSTALLSTSCSKKPLCCVLPPAVVITAQKNGQDWQLPIIKSTVANNNISINTAGPQLLNTAKDSLSINLAYTGLGNYALTDQQITYTVFSNGTKTNYVLDTTFDNTFTITNYTTPTNGATAGSDATVLKATFNLKFVDPAHTTSVSLLDGKFTAYLGN
ncbi:MAG TPA: hypothetical protein VK668_05200 [Mucilaginibacter sp.]|nr:hypothetical protein [Mucilaginibacter sp.]